MSRKLFSTLIRLAASLACVLGISFHYTQAYGAAGDSQAAVHYAHYLHYVDGPEYRSSKLIAEAHYTHGYAQDYATQHYAAAAVRSYDYYLSHYNRYSGHYHAYMQKDSRYRLNSRDYRDYGYVPMGEAQHNESTSQADVDYQQSAQYGSSPTYLREYHFSPSTGMYIARQYGGSRMSADG